MKKKSSFLTIKSVVRTLSLKFYEEQIPEGVEELSRRVRELPSSEYQVLLICHDKDVAEDSIWEPSILKPHWHLYLRVLNGKTYTVGFLLSLLGIQYRRDLDDGLWKEHGVETCGDFASCALYITHETEECFKKGKYVYPLSDVVSNLSLEELRQVREGYVRVSKARKKLSPSEWEELASEAYNLGYNFGDFDKFQLHLPFSVICSGKMSGLKKRYDAGVSARIVERPLIPRLCLFIKGEPNVGKTYASMYALRDVPFLRIGGAGSGRFDSILPSTDAIICDDDSFSVSLDVFESYPCQLYRRGSSNPYWCGHYFIITSNLPFGVWASQCGFNSLSLEPSEEVQYQAFKTRFYIAHIDAQRLVLDYRSPRGSSEYRAEVAFLYERFSSDFEASLREYASLYKN